MGNKTGMDRKASNVIDGREMKNTKDLDNPFIRNGHGSPQIELSREDLLDELQIAFACYIAWDWTEGEFDEAKAQRAYRKIEELLKSGNV